MGFPFSFSQFSLFSSFSLIATLLFSPTTATDTDLYNLVYRGCAKQTYPSGSPFQQSFDTVFTSLVANSSIARFFKTSAAAAGGETAVSGLFQCRGDLGAADCNGCVRRLPEIAGEVCGQSIAGRVHLAGCYIAYQTDEFPQISGTELLYEKCSSSVGGGKGFEEKTEGAFDQLESGVAGGSGFYATNYNNSVSVVAQCEGDLGPSDCGVCIKETIRRAQVECGNAVAGQVYLNRCYMSYSYSQKGAPRHASGQPTRKTVAIVVGGAAAVGFAVIFLLFLRSLIKKRDDD